jgi:hypothetical protein
MRTASSLLDTQIDFWAIDLATFEIEIVLNLRLGPMDAKKFAQSKRQVPRLILRLSQKSASASTIRRYRRLTTVIRKS